MRRVGTSSFVGLGILFLANGLSAQELAAIPPEHPGGYPSVFMRVYGSAEPPSAFNRFCQENPEECTATSKTMTRVDASPEALRALDEINRHVNQTITPETDLQHYGIEDYWTLPMDGKGDCEDYALLKRHELMKVGWPSSALLMTVVSDEKGKGHAVLTARTTEGDFILDNKVDEVRLWNQTPYQFLMRQSYLNPRVWVALDPMRHVTPVPIAGFGARR